MTTTRQDFENYARIKTFNLNVADTWDRAMREALERSDRPRGECRILDYGCGDGKYFKHLIGLGLSAENIHGIEISKVRIERCHALGWTHARYLEKGDPLPYPADTFDVVNLMEVVEHVPDTLIDSVLAEIWRVVRPHGVLIVSTPNYPIKRFYDLYDAVVFRKWQRLRDDPTHVTFYNHARLARLLGGYFTRLDERPFKLGFLYRRLLRSRFVMHKVLMLCSEKSATPRTHPGTA
jgi:SAM-dependent methyltransferase